MKLTEEQLRKLAIAVGTDDHTSGVQNKVRSLVNTLFPGDEGYTAKQRLSTAEKYLAFLEHDPKKNNDILSQEDMQEVLMHLSEEEKKLFEKDADRLST